MAKKTLQEGEDLFDFLRRQATDQLSEDAFDGVSNVFVKVLRVFEIPIPRKGMNWVTAVMPEVRLGKRKTVMAFKGRVFTNNYEKYLTIHSSIPEPDEYQKDIFIDNYIDMHPTFLILKDTSNQKLEKNDICRCTFPSSYAEAGGDSYGFFVDKIGDVESTGLKTRQEKMAKESFKPKSRIFDPPPAPVSFFDKLPLNIVLLGDNMFGASPTKLGTDNSFTSTLKKKILGLYKDLDKMAQKKAFAPKIAEKYLLNGDVVKKVEQKIREESLRVPYKNLKIHNLAVGNTDATYYDPAQTSKLYSGKAGKIKIAETGGTVKSGAEIIDNIKHFKRPNFKGDPESPKFFIAGFEGNSSAIPGWAGLLQPGGGGKFTAALDTIAYGAWGGDDPLKATKKEYTQLQKYAELVAIQDPGRFTDVKKEQFKAMLDHLKNAGMEGGIFVGPLVFTGTGKSTFPHSWNTVSEETYPGAYTFSVIPFKKSKSKTIREPIFHSGFKYRSRMSDGMRKAAEGHSLKTWTCLPYCVRNNISPSSSRSDIIMAGKDGSYLSPPPISSGASRNSKKRRQKILIGWILNNLLAYTIGETPDTTSPKPKFAGSAYGDQSPLNKKLDADDIGKSARGKRALMIQKELVKELDRIYQSTLDQNGAHVADPAADMLQYTNKKVKDINAFLKSSVLGFSKLP